MPLDEARTTADIAVDHRSDHDALHPRYNDGGWEAWIAVSGGIGFENGWLNFDSGHAAAGYRKHADGMVQIRGLVKTGADGAGMFTLPSGYRPAATLLVAITDGAGEVVRLDLGTGGTMGPVAGINRNFVSINIMFDSTGGT